MKKTIIISAIALGFLINSSNAATFIEDMPEAHQIRTKIEKRSYCITITNGNIETVVEIQVIDYSLPITIASNPCLIRR